MCVNFTKVVMQSPSHLTVLSYVGDSECKCSCITANTIII